MFEFRGLTARRNENANAGILSIIEHLLNTQIDNIIFKFRIIEQTYSRYR